ncbi:50S ribosomal protein L10 [Archaeoglobus veneficus]|uniref:Large ribosomal subunit protein uL10 n=1 Tax=Archaeoglobus veneficus (strain DSM 11195 / SNP6) TaxID=693661 RepID=F2KSQ9_ARCVS|nr:50S ribosomal protein L10 [Archaeoglobus veneficus]AEA46954.1 Acidic ribosomal protein P0-like protein [Archaeoglobus veneficus SNP6]
MAAVRGTPKPWKVQAVEEVKRLFTGYPVVALVSFRGVTARQMQDIRRNFRDFAVIWVTKNTLIEKALRSLGGDYEKVLDYLGDQIAIVATQLNPFKLYKKLEETKVPSPLKPGQVSPVDVVVEKGPTSFPPGPVIGDLQAGGIPAAIEKGKIVIEETVTVVKAGEVVKPEVARALELLEVKPVKLGLDVRVVYENGVVFTPDMLAIDAGKVFEDFVDAYRKALNLAVNAAYVAPETAEILIAKAVMDARNLAINAAIFEKDVIEDILAKAHGEMLSLVSLLPPEALDEELLNLRSAVPAQVSVEEKKEEAVEEEKEEEEEEEKEEEALEGFGALFG